MASGARMMRLGYMPTYEYTCEKCGHQFEIQQPMSAAALTVCPKDHCKLEKWGKGRVKRIIGGGAGIIFKGSGFYITDYRSENYKAAAKKDTAPATNSSSDGKTSTTKTESKPAATPNSSKT